MEIVNANCATLSNYEVLKHLQKIKDSKKKHKGQLATITYETIRYLENAACNDQAPENIKECLKSLESYNLNKTEKLMIINSPPTTALEIQLISLHVMEAAFSARSQLLCNTPGFYNYYEFSAGNFQRMIEESEERLTEAQVAQILDIIARYFPHIIKDKIDENDEIPE